MSNQAVEIQSDVHLVFGLSDAGSLKVTFSEIGKRRENLVLAFNDLFSIGPIKNLDSREGRQMRQRWFMERFADYSLNHVLNEEHQLEHMLETLAGIPETKPITIWCGDNAHDQTGLRFVLYVLKQREQPIRIANVSELFMELRPEAEVLVPPYAQGLIEKNVYREMVERCSRLKLLDASTRRQYESEWLALSGQDHTLRLWLEGEVIGCEEDRLDASILKAVTECQEMSDEDGFVKAGRVVTNVFEHINQLVGDAFINYRIWTLISDGYLGFRGLPVALHQYAIKVLPRNEDVERGVQSPKHIISVSALVKNAKGEVLLLRTHWRSDTWEMPGGNVELGEPLDEAIRREFLEETGIVIRPIGITGVYCNASKQVISVVFHAEYVSGEIQIQPEEIIEARYIRLDEHNIGQWITRPQQKSRTLDAMKAEEMVPYETWEVNPTYNLLGRLHHHS